MNKYTAIFGSSAKRIRLGHNTLASNRECADSYAHCCGNCIFFWDEWLDGTGKCARACDGITHESSGSKCKVFKGIWDYS